MAAFDASHTSIHNSSRDQQQQQMGSKRHCFAKAKAKPGPSRFVRFVVRNQMGRDMEFNMRDDTRMKKLFAAYRDKTQLDGYKLIFDGRRLFPEDTPRDIGLEDGDIVDAILEQRGD
jgi:small ubiquitin-related modifier